MAPERSAQTTGGGHSGDLNEFEHILSVFNVEVDTSGKDGRNALHKDAEAIYMRLLNELYDWELEDANPPGRSEKAIDLIDRTRHIVVQVSSECTSRKINETIRKMNSALQRGEEVPYRGEPGKPYRLKFAFVGYEDPKERGGAQQRWSLEEPRGFEFDRRVDTIFTSGLTHAFKDLYPERRMKVLSLVRGDVGRVGSLTPFRLVAPDVVAQINEYLIIQREHHPSFVLMNGGPDKCGLPRAELIPNDRRRVIVDGGEIAYLSEVLRKSWETDRQSHLFITGPGGVGKTIALLTLSTERDCLPAGVPVVYVPLYGLSQYQGKKRDCIDKYLQKTFARDEYKTIDKLSRRPWGRGPSLILLLDGHNEVSAGKRVDVDDGIRKWVERQGVQIITTSRFLSLGNMARAHQVAIQALEETEVKAHLSASKVIEPLDSSNLWKILETPLMLRLYSDVESFRKVMSKPYIHLEDADNAGHLVWNYLQRELWSIIEANKGDFPKVEYAAALLLTLPYVCWRMETEHELTVPQERLLMYMQESCEHWHGKDKPPLFYRTEFVLRSYYDDCDTKKTMGNQLAILSDETGLLNWNGEGYSLLHQSLRDGLAAIHLKNVMEAPYGELPKEFRHSISQSVNDFLADVCEVERLENLWTANKVTGQADSVATYNILRVMSEKCSGNLMRLDWSGMDIRGTSLFPFKVGDRINLSSVSECFAGTKMNIDCFMPQGHASNVNSISYSPFGRLLVSGSSDGTLRLWDPLAGRQIGPPFEGHEDWVRSVCFSPNYGTLIASGSSDGTVRLWDTSTGRQSCAPLEGHENWVRSVCFSPDGKLLASGSSDGTVRLWNPAKGSSVGEPFRGHSGKVRSVCFSPDGKLLASGSSDGTVRLWNPLSGCEVGKPLMGHQKRVRSVRFSPDTSDGYLLASGSDDGTVRLWRLRHNETHGEVGSPLLDGRSRIRTVCFSSDGRLLAIGMADGTIALWDVETRRRIDPWPNGHKGKVLTLCFMLNDDCLASGSDDGTVRRWDVATGKQIGDPLEGHRIRMRSVCFSPDGRLLASGSSDGTVRLWDPVTGEQCGDPLEGHSGRVRSVCFSRDGKLLASGSSDRTIILWDPKTGKQIGEPLEGHADRVRCICASPTENLLASGSDDYSVRLWDLETREQTHRPLEGHHGLVRSVSFSPDGKLLASGSSDGTVRLWDVAAGEQIGILGRHGHAVRSVCFSPDGALLASASSNFTVRLWDITRPIEEPDDERCRVLKGHRGRVRCVCFSPDGSLVVSGSDDRTLRLWNARTGEPVGEPIEGHRDWIKCVCFSSDGKLLASGSYDRTIRLWIAGDDAITSETGRAVRLLRIMEPPLGIDLHGLDLSKADIEDEHDREVLRQNGAIV